MAVPASTSTSVVADQAASSSTSVKAANGGAQPFDPHTGYALAWLTMRQLIDLGLAHFI